MDRQREWPMEEKDWAEIVRAPWVQKLYLKTLADYDKVPREELAMIMKFLIMWADYDRLQTEWIGKPVRHQVMRTLYPQHMDMVRKLILDIDSWTGYTYQVAEEATRQAEKSEKSVEEVLMLCQKHMEAE